MLISAIWAMLGVGHRSTTHRVFFTRTSWWTRAQTVSSYRFWFAAGTSASSDTLVLPRAPM